jgi:ABC-2 type transport system ATP-binding protein
VELTFDAPRSVPSKVPESWMHLNSSAAVVRFIECHFDKERTSAEARSVFGEARNMTFSPMSLRSIFLAMARAGRDTA